MIYDSNLIIYSILPQYPGLLRLMNRIKPEVSRISKVEVLGYHKIAHNDRIAFEKFFAGTTVLPVTDAVVDDAAILRRTHNMGLADSIIAATALLTGQELHTHDVKDFAGIPGLTVIDPLAHGDPP